MGYVFLALKNSRLWPMIADTALSLRPAEMADLDAIMEMEKMGFSLGSQELRSTFEQRIRDYPEGFLFALDEMTGAAVGYFCSERWTLQKNIPDQNFSLDHNISTLLDKSGEELYISSMTILPKYRGYGLGRQFFRLCIEYMLNHEKGLSSVVLIVNVDWIPAIKIYNDYGFTVIKTIHGFFGQSGVNTQDGLVMRMEIK